MIIFYYVVKCRYFMWQVHCISNSAISVTDFATCVTVVHLWHISVSVFHFYHVTYFYAPPPMRGH